MSGPRNGVGPMSRNFFFLPKTTTISLLVMFLISEKNSGTFFFKINDVNCFVFVLKENIGKMRKKRKYSLLKF